VNTWIPVRSWKKVTTATMEALRSMPKLSYQKVASRKFS